MKIDINHAQREIIWKAINNLSILYDFDNLTNEDFKFCYRGFSKQEIVKASEELKEVLQ